MADYREIWLEPECCAGCEGRQWSEDQPWDRCEDDIDPTKYIRADISEGAIRLAERVAALNPDAGEIGAGMLAQLVEDARRIVGEP